MKWHLRPSHDFLGVFPNPVQRGDQTGVSATEARKAASPDCAPGSRIPQQRRAGRQSRRPDERADGRRKGGNYRSGGPPGRPTSATAQQQQQQSACVKNNVRVQGRCRLIGCWDGGGGGETKGASETSRLDSKLCSPSRRFECL